MAQQQLQDLNPPGLVVALIDAAPERAAQRPERVAGAAMVDRAAVAFGPDEPMHPADGGAVGPVMEAMAEEVRDFVGPFGPQRIQRRMLQRIRLPGESVRLQESENRLAEVCGALQASQAAFEQRERWWTANVRGLETTAEGHIANRDRLLQEAEHRWRAEQNEVGQAYHRARLELESQAAALRAAEAADRQLRLDADTVASQAALQVGSTRHAEERVRQERDFLRGEVQNLTGELRAERETSVSRDRRAADVSGHAEALRQRVLALEAEVARFRDARAEDQRRLHEKVLTEGELRDQLRLARSSINGQSAAEIATLSSQNAALRDQLSQLQRRVEKIETDLAASRRQVVELEGDKRRLERAVDDNAITIEQLSARKRHKRV